MKWCGGTVRLALVWCLGFNSLGQYLFLPFSRQFPWQMGSSLQLAPAGLLGPGSSVQPSPYFFGFEFQMIGPNMYKETCQKKSQTQPWCGGKTCSSLVADRGFESSSPPLFWYIIQKCVEHFIYYNHFWYIATLLGRCIRGSLMHGAFYLLQPFLIYCNTFRPLHEG